MGLGEGTVGKMAQKEHGAAGGGSSLQQEEYALCSKSNVKALEGFNTGA